MGQRGGSHHAALQRAFRAQGTTTSDPAASTGILAISCSLLALASWLILARWYSLVEHYSTPGFAFDKIPGHFASPTIRYTLVLFLVLTLVYAGIYLLIRKVSRISGGLKFAAILMIVGSGLANILIYPVAAIDLFYYLAQFKLVYHYHQNPYLVTFVPSFAADPLARFGWPLQVPSPYGPAWLLILGGPTAFAGLGNLIRLLLVYKALSFIFVLVAGLLIFMYQDEEKSSWLGAYAFLANPLIWFEAVANAHNDLIMTVFLLGAMLALKRRSWLVLPLLTLAALIKVFAVVLVPLFLLEIYRARWRRKDFILSALLALGVLIAVVAPFWANGKMLGGMLRGMEFANDLRTASVVSLTMEYLAQQDASSTALSIARLGFGALFLLSTAVIMWKSRSFERSLVYVLLLFYMLVGSLNPWYFIPIIALLACRQNGAGTGYLFVVTALGLIIYQVDLWARFNADLLPFRRQVAGVLFLLLPMIGFLAVEMWLAASPSQRGAGKNRTRPQLLDG